MMNSRISVSISGFLGRGGSKIRDRDYATSLYCVYGLNHKYTPMKFLSSIHLYNFEIFPIFYVEISKTISIQIWCFEQQWISGFLFEPYPFLLGKKIDNEGKHEKSLLLF